MTTSWDEPVPYALTELAEETLRGFMTTVQASEELGIWPESVAALAARGVIVGGKVGGRWRLEPGSVRRHQRARQARWVAELRRRLPVEPLLRQIELRGGRAACGVGQHTMESKAIDRAMRQGYVTLAAADFLAVRLLGMTLYELWPDAA